MDRSLFPGVYKESGLADQGLSKVPQQNNNNNPHTCAASRSNTRDNGDTVSPGESPVLDLDQFGAEPVSFLDLMHAVLHNKHDDAHLGLTNFIPTIVAAEVPHRARS